MRHQNAIKVLADGTHLEPGSDRTDHVAVIFVDAGLMIHTATIGTAAGNAQDHAACTRACTDLRVLGFDDWTLASREHWERHILDLERHDPAVDPSLFPGIRPVGHWTSTPAAWSSASAWLVNANGGLVGNYHRNAHGFAVAVRRVGQ